MLSPVRKLRELQRRVRHQRLAASIDAILSAPGDPDTRRAESDFEQLQSGAPDLGEYCYDAVSLLLRASTRTARILAHVAPAAKPLKVLEVAPGDGTLGALFDAGGHEVDLCDVEDWRTESAKHLKFEAADCCAGLPYATGAFDIVCSFNSMEHFADPAAAFNEMVRVTRPNGLVYLDFAPLYCSPLGLHAHGSLKMPYPQFLFSEEFISVKLRELGIRDLGKELSELQYLNKWKPSQFTALWESAAASVVSSYQAVDTDHLRIVRRYPEAFKGRSLTFSDVTCTSLQIALRKAA